jgi:hypothetical protein
LDILEPIIIFFFNSFLFLGSGVCCLFVWLMSTTGVI